MFVRISRYFLKFKIFESFQCVTSYAHYFLAFIWSFVGQRAADDLWLVFCLYVCLKYLLPEFDIYFVWNTMRSSKKLINKKNKKQIFRQTCVRQKDFNKQKIIKTFCYKVFKEMFTFLFLYFDSSFFSSLILNKYIYIMLIVSSLCPLLLFSPKEFSPKEIIERGKKCVLIIMN